MTQPPSPLSSASFGPRYYTALVLAFFALICVPLTEARASNTAPPPDSESAPRYEKFLGEQFGKILRSNIQTVREDALAALLALVQREDYDLRGTAPVLISMYENPQHPKERKMAATALCLLGDEVSIEALVLLSDADADPNVQRHARRRIIAYYLHTYPELADRINERGQLPYRHIQRAKRQRARARSEAVAVRPS